MIKSLTNFFSHLMERYLPDAFVFALLLTFIVFGLGCLFTPVSPSQMISFWGESLWNLLKFAMEMALILSSGYVLAKTHLVSMAIDRLAKFGKDQASAVLIATTLSSLACLINWGFGLIVAALISTELYKRNKDLNFALLVASSYSGFLLWHGGFSGSIPLKLTSPSVAISEIIGDTGYTLSESILSSFNLIVLIGNFVLILLINFFLSKDTDFKKVNVLNDLDKTASSGESKEKNEYFASKIENSRTLNILVGLFSFAYLYFYLEAGKKVNLSFLCFLFFFSGVVLHKSIKDFIEHFSDGVLKSSSIIIQFPLYAGIMGMMAKSGLSDLLTQTLVSISNENTFFLMTYLSAGILNFFVPSGGGQWALQAPIILPAAKTLGLDMVKASMAIAWGDSWTNMIQPFWALPLLSISGLNLKDILKYTAVIFLFSGIFTSAIFVILSL